jgi:hypothetical protein
MLYVLCFNIKNPDDDFIQLKPVVLYNNKFVLTCVVLMAVMDNFYKHNTSGCPYINVNIQLQSGYYSERRGSKV